MLYLHRLNDLNPKTADNESLTLIRELKQKFNFPFSVPQVQESLEIYSLSPQELEKIKKALDTIEPTSGQIKRILAEKNPLHEPINLQRGIQILNSLVVPLQLNLAYLQERLDKQKELASQTTELLNSIPYLKTKEQKIEVNEKISRLFEEILRNKELSFRYLDIIHEGLINDLGGLKEGMAKNFFFHITLEEELRKADPHAIRNRIPLENLKEVEQIEDGLSQIYTGVETAYKVNYRMICLTVLLYSFVKWVNRDIKR